MPTTYQDVFGLDLLQLLVDWREKVPLEYLQRGWLGMCKKTQQPPQSSSYLLEYSKVGGIWSEAHEHGAASLARAWHRRHLCCDDWVVCKTLAKHVRVVEAIKIHPLAPWVEDFVHDPESIWQAIVYPLSLVTCALAYPARV